MGLLRIAGIDDNAVAVQAAGKGGKRIGLALLEGTRHLHIVRGTGRHGFLTGIIDCNLTGDFLTGGLEPDLGRPFEIHREADLGNQALEEQVRPGGLRHPEGSTGAGLGHRNLERETAPAERNPFRSRRDGDEGSLPFRHLAGELGHLTGGGPVRKRLDRGTVRQEDGVALRPGGLGAVRQIRQGGREHDVARERDVRVHVAGRIPGAAHIGNLDGIAAGRQQRQGGDQKDQCFFHIGKCLIVIS